MRVTPFLVRCSEWTSSAGGTPEVEPLGGGGSAVCVRGTDTNSRRWLRPWPRLLTTQPHGARGWPGPGGGGRELKFTAAFRMMPSPRRQGAVYFEMDTGEDDGSAPAAMRPAPLLEVRPQERVQQRTMEQIVDPVPVVPMLHVFVPQMVEQLVDILAPLDFRIGEQVIEVPKIVCPPRAARTVLRAPQTADQLVEVPTPVSYSSLLQRTLEQIADIPVPSGRGGRDADLPGFLRGQGPTAHSSSLVHISEQIVEQIADIPVAREGLADFRPGQSSSSIAHSPAAWLDPEDEPVSTGFFALFPRKKKVQMSPGTWVRECPGTSAHPRRQLMARALGLTTTRVRYGRCSRTRRSARGGTARGRVAPSGTRRGSAEPGCAGAVDVPVLMQRRGLLAVLRPG